jgi:hypothetical protein
VLQRNSRVVIKKGEYIVQKQHEHGMVVVCCEFVFWMPYVLANQTRGESHLLDVLVAQCTRDELWKSYEPATRQGRNVTCTFYC